MSERRAERLAVVWIALSVAGSVLFAVAYVLDASTQLLGLGLALACCGLMALLMTWSKYLLPDEQVVDERHSEQAPPEERAAAVAELEEGFATVVARRRWLARLGYAAAGILGLAALFPLRSLGPSPEGRVGATNWRSGLRFVREDGTPVRAVDVPVGSFTTAFPSGYVGPDHIADMTRDAVALVHLEAGELALPPERSGWAPQGFVAYSKVCTHAGCPVALYRDETHELMCPCHQSVFDVRDGATVVSGPAARPLPQLPVTIAEDGTIVAAGMMSGVIGADRWEFPWSAH